MHKSGKITQIGVKLLKKVLTPETPRCCAVIAAAGSSERFNREDKLFIQLNGAPVLAHTLTAFQRSVHINEIVLVTREETLDRAQETCERYGIKKLKAIITGGATRLESVFNGAYAASDECNLIAIHDGARPCVDGNLIKRTVDMAAKHHAVAPGIRINSTVKRFSKGMIIETIDREELLEIQTPQVFQSDIIKAALSVAVETSQDITDDCMAAELIGVPVRVTEGSRFNIKLTTREDIIVAEAIIKWFVSRRKQDNAIPL